MTVCKQCKVEKEDTEFSKNRRVCKECRAANGKSYYKTNSEKIKEKSKSPEVMKRKRDYQRESIKEDVSVVNHILQEKRRKQKSYLINRNEKARSYSSSYLSSYLSLL